MAQIRAVENRLAQDGADDAVLDNVAKGRADFVVIEMEKERRGRPSDPPVRNTDVQDRLCLARH
jgi:hypothetical protein